MGISTTRIDKLDMDILTKNTRCYYEINCGNENIGGLAIAHYQKARQAFGHMQRSGMGEDEIQLFFE